MPSKKVKKVPTKKKGSKSLASAPRFSKRSLILFGIIFALIGAFLLYKIFAVNRTVHYFGALTASRPTAAYKLTTGAGDMKISYSNNTADVTLTVTNKAGRTIGTLKSRGKRDVKMTLPVVADTYTISLNPTARFTQKKGYSIYVTYPTSEIGTNPTAIISSPLSNATLKGVVDFTAIAQDNIGVTRVEFFVDGNLLDTEYSSPYSVKWDTTQSSNGAHTFSVKSYDAAGNTGEASGVAEILNLIPEEPTSNQRFPGDPNPRVTGKAYYGAAIGGNADPIKHEGPTGVSLSVRRTFWDWSGATNMTSGMYKTIDADLKANRLPFVSIKTPGWKAVGNGTYDAQLDAIIKKLNSYGKPIWFVVHHEPEGGAGSNVPDDPDGPSAWRAAQTRVRQRMTAVGSKNVAFMPILMSYTWNPASGRNPNDWWVPGIWDAYIVDHYRDNVTGDMFTSNHWPNFVAWIEPKDMPYGTGEWGNRGADAQAAKENQAFWDWGFANKKDVVVHSYFDSSLNSPNGSWELTGETLKNFQYILKNDTRVQRINSLK